MNHTDSGALMAYLDGELPVRDRTALDAHIDACDVCRDELSELRAFAREFTQAISLLNGRIPLLSARAAVETAAAPPRRRRADRFVAASLLKAAAVVLLLAGAASAAIPGSPVRSLIEAAANRLAGSPHVVEPATPAPTVASDALIPQEPEGPGVTIAADQAVRISIHSPDTRARVAVRMIDGDRVTVRALGANESVRFAPRDGAVDVYGVQTGLVIDLPRSLRSASVLVDGKPYYVKDGSDEQVLGPGAESWGDGFVFQQHSR